MVSEEVNSIDKALYEQIVLVEKDLFHEKNWSPFFWRLLQNKTALVETRASTAACGLGGLFGGKTSRGTVTVFLRVHPEEIELDRTG